MGCKFSNFHDGTCQVNSNAADEDNVCVCEEDPNPEDTCDSYESIDGDDDEVEYKDDYKPSKDDLDEFIDDDEFEEEEPVRSFGTTGAVLGYK